MTNDTAIASAPVTCACGCGTITSFGRVEALVREGKNRAQISTELNMSHEHLKSILRQPPRYSVGHWRQDTASGLRALATHGERRAFRLRDQARSIATRSRPLKADAQRIRALRTEAHAAELAAIDRAIMAGISARLQPRPTLTMVRTKTLLTLEQTRRVLVERDWEDIQALRNKVGEGWRRDSDPRDHKLIYLEDMALRYEKYGMDYLDILAQKQDERAILEAEHAAAAEVMKLPYLRDLVGAAVASPKNLTEADRAVLRDYFLSAYRGEGLPGGQLETAGQPAQLDVVGGPAGGGGWKRGRGTGRHGTTRHLQGQKRFEGKRDLLLDRAIQQARELKYA